MRLIVNKKIPFSPAVSPSVKFVHSQVAIFAISQMPQTGEKFSSKPKSKHLMVCFFYPYQAIQRFSSARLST